MKRGFSLVELSIVLVILGLLTGGILAGQSLIRASELRGVSTEYQRYSAATQAFRDKYFNIPGDFRDATRFWGRTQVYACITNSAAAVTTPGACDGNGDGILTWGAGPTSSSESLQFWRQLALAGIIEGSYTGLITAGGTYVENFATQVPGSKLSNGVWGTFYPAQFAAAYTTNFTTVSYINGFIFGGRSADLNYAWNTGEVLKPEEAWNIDTKMDDGKPGTGSVLGEAKATCSTASSQTDTTATYSFGAAGCYLVFTKGI